VWSRRGGDPDVLRALSARGEDQAVLRDGLDRLHERLMDVEQQRASWQGQLRQQVDDMRHSTDLLRRETGVLSTALRKPHVRGQWGELHLRKAVELAGMVEHCDFQEQVHIAHEDGHHRPDLVVSAGFRKLVGPDFLGQFGGRFVNTHNALLPSFPGIHGPRDALAYGVKVTGATLFVVDEGVDTGVIVAQVAVPVDDDDDVDTLTERIKVAERAMLVDWVGRMARAGFTVSGRKVTIP